MHYVLLSMLAGALFGGGMAIAQSPDMPAQENKKPHFLSKFDQQFRAADRDGDGALTKTEAESAQMGRIVNHFDRLDADKNGKLTRSEIRALVRTKLSS